MVAWFCKMPVAIGEGFFFWHERGVGLMGNFWEGAMGGGGGEEDGDRHG